MTVWPIHNGSPLCTSPARSYPPHIVVTCTLSIFGAWPRKPDVNLTMAAQGLANDVTNTQRRDGVPEQYMVTYVNPYLNGGGVDLEFPMCM